MLGDFISAILAKIVALAAWFGNLFKAVFVAAWDILRDAAAWVFDQVLSIAVSALGALDVSAISGALGIFQQIPAGIRDVMSAVGAGTCFGIIGSAIVIRLILQLIPFTRLGS